MAVMLRLRLDCAPEAAWRALQSPTVMREIAGPWMGVVSEERGGFPERWTPGDHPVRLTLGGLVPIGDQDIDLAFDTESHAGVAIVRDTGGGVDGLPGLIRSWYHRMAVSRHPDDPAATLYRDRLEFDAGALTPAVWSGLWPLWQWRGLRLTRLAPGFDEIAPPAADAEAAEVAEA